MTVRATFPRGRTWPCRLAALGLAALLPLAPGWAQPPATPAEPPRRVAEPPPALPRPETPAEAERTPPASADQVRLREYTRALSAARGAADDQFRKEVDRVQEELRANLGDLGAPANDAIRKAFDRLRALADRRARAEVEEAKRVDRESVYLKRGDAARPEPAPEPPNDPDRQKQVAKARAEVQVLTDRLRQARERLTQLEGISVVRVRPVRPDVEYRVVTPSYHGDADLELRPPAPAAPDQEQRLRALERRLDQVVDELRSLKRPAPRPEGERPQAK